VSAARASSGRPAPGTRKGKERRLREHRCHHRAGAEAYRALLAIQPDCCARKGLRGIGRTDAVSFRCGPFQKKYSHVTRATIIDADGEHSNSVDFTVSRNLAVSQLTGAGPVSHAVYGAAERFVDLYLANAEAGPLLTRRKVAKKASTIATVKGRIARHIKPLLGNMKVAAVVREDIDAFMHDVAEGKTAGKRRRRNGA
jgi:hypothetical protein